MPRRPRPGSHCGHVSGTGATGRSPATPVCPPPSGPGVWPGHEGSGRARGRAGSARHDPELLEAEGQGRPWGVPPPARPPARAAASAPRCAHTARHRPAARGSQDGARTTKCSRGPGWSQGRGEPESPDSSSPRRPRASSSGLAAGRTGDRQVGGVGRALRAAQGAGEGPARKDGQDRSAGLHCRGSDEPPEGCPDAGA